MNERIKGEKSFVFVGEGSSLSFVYIYMCMYISSCSSFSPAFYNFCKWAYFLLSVNRYGPSHESDRSVMNDKSLVERFSNVTLHFPKKNITSHFLNLI